MQIRYFRNRDLAEVNQVAYVSLQERYDPMLFLQFAPYWPEGFIVMEDRGRVIGFIFGVRSGPQQARILMLVIDSSFRGGGLGTMLTNQFFCECAKKGLRQVALEVRASNSKALRFYQRLGFFNVRRISDYYSNGEDGISMLRYL